MLQCGGSNVTVCHFCRAGMLGNGNRHSDWNRNANKSTNNGDRNYLTGVGGNRNRSTNCIAARLQFSLG